MENLEKKKTKLTIFSDLPEEGFFSMERYANELADHLALVRPSWQIENFTSRKTKFIRPLRLILRWLPFFKDYGHDLFFSRLLLYPWWAKKHQGDVNHVVDHSYGHLLFHLDPSRTVVTCHDLIPLEYEKDPAALRVFRYSVGGLARAAKILAVSQATKRDLVEELGIEPEKIKVIYLGVDQGKFKVQSQKSKVEAVRRRYSLPEGKILLHVGNSLVYKNIEGILRSLKLVLAEVKDIYLLKVGKLASSQRKLVGELGIEGRVLEQANILDEDLAAFYQLANVLVYPSFKEGFGFPVLEALACGCPVVVSKGTSLEELAGKAAFLVNPQDTGSIAGGILKVLRSNTLEYRTKVELGLRRAKEFSWERCAQETVKVYEEVCKTITRRVQN